MHPRISFFLGLLWLTGAGPAQSIPSPVPQAALSFRNLPGPLDSVHPDYTRSSLLPEGLHLKVAGMDWLPNGDMAVLSIQDTVLPVSGGRGGKGWVYILSGARQAPPSRPALKPLYHGFANPLGLAVSGGRIHVSQRMGLVRLEDGDGDGIPDTLIQVAGYPDSDWEYWGRWSMSVVHREGRFYTGLGASHYTFPKGPCLPAARRGTVHRTDGAGQDELLGFGLREPNGIGFGPEGEIFATDNDGEWVPANKLVHVRKDRFYGLVACDAWDPSLVHTPPAVWFPKFLRSPTQPLSFPMGPFKGQMVVGDYNVPNLSRIFLEKVEGQYQGALFPFTGGLASGGMRLLADEQGSLYVGELTIESSEAWWVEGMKPGGLEKLAFNGTVAFEMLAIRALQDGFELEFTGPASLPEESPGGYRVRQWRLEPTPGYGGRMLELETLTVAAAVLSADGRRIRLRVPGLKPGRVAHIQLHDGFRSADGRAPWAYEAWYTLNAVPGRTEGARPPPGGRDGPRVSLRRSGARVVALAVDAGPEGGAEIRVQDLRGRRILSGRVEGEGEIALPRLPSGLYAVVIRAGGRVYHRRLPLL